MSITGRIRHGVFAGAAQAGAALAGILLAGTVHAADLSGQDRAEAVGKSLVGTPAPRMVLKTIDGESIDLGALYGKKAVYLKFWATWCVPCRAQMPHFQHAYENAGPDLAVIAVNAGFDDSVAEVQKYRRIVGITMPIVFDDGRLGAAFRLRVTPQHIIIGRDGRIQYVGHLADARLDAALAAARQPGLATAAVRDASTPMDIPAIQVGDLLPARAVKTLEGKSFAFRDPRARQSTVLVFLSPWCESYLATSRPAISANCRKTREMIDGLSGQQKARWIGIGSGLWATAADLEKYRDDYKVQIPLTLDASGALFRAFRITDVPTVLIADRDGKLVRRLVRDEADGLPGALASAP